MSTGQGIFSSTTPTWPVSLRVVLGRRLLDVSPDLALIRLPCTDFCSEKMIAGWKQDPLNTYGIDELLDKYIALYNNCISQAPADMHIGIHLCRGNFVNSRHFSEGGYDRIATKLFKELNMHTY